MIEKAVTLPLVRGEMRLLPDIQRPTEPVTEIHGGVLIDNPTPGRPLETGMFGQVLKAEAQKLEAGVPVEPGRYFALRTPTEKSRVLGIE